MKHQIENWLRGERRLRTPGSTGWLDLSALAPRATATLTAAHREVEPRSGAPGGAGALYSPPACCGSASTSTTSRPCARRGARKQPDPVHAAVLAEMGGADGITVHLRGDRRHIQDRDLEVLRQTVRTRLNLEMAATQEMTRIALTVKPNQVTLVPERREEVTTEGGLDVVLNSVQIRPMVKTLQDAGIEVSLFVDPELEQVKEAHKLDAHAVELNTAAWSEAAQRAGARGGAPQADRRRPARAASWGSRCTPGTASTTRTWARSPRMSEISELNIGHAIVARAVLVGMERAVREMAEAMRAGRVRPGLTRFRKPPMLGPLP